MDFLKAQFTRIQQQLNGLSATQKMLTASLLAIMVMTLLWWSHWAAEPEMSALLDQSLSQGDLGQIVSNLDAQGIPHTVVGDKVMVPTERKLEILAELGFSQALPRNFDTGFDEMIKQSNWFDSPEKSADMRLHLKQRVLSEVIRRFPGVQDAVVVIDPSSDRRIDSADVQPVATVTITSKGNSKQANRQLAESAANVVSGAQAGLLRNHINVVIDGATYAIKDQGDDSSVSSDDNVEAQKKFEDYYRGKIEDVLKDIPGIMVSVTVKVNTAGTIESTHKVDPKNTVDIPLRSEETDEQNAGEAAQSTEPGAVPNAPLTLGSAGGGGSGTSGGSTSTSSKNEFDADHGKTDIYTRQAPGDGTVQTASVKIPRSYFLNIYKAEKGTTPDETALAAYSAKIFDVIRGEVRGCAVFPSDQALYVGMYTDIAPPESTAPLPASTSGMTVAMGAHTKEIGVGVLAMVSLFMVSMMVRKGAPAPAVVEPMMIDEPEEEPLVEKVRNAADGSAALDGVELDPEMVKSQQVVEQVQQMVKANPDGAASLVKRWLAH